MKNPTITLPAFGSLIASQGGMFAAIMRGPVIDGIEQPPYALLISPKESGEIEDCEWGHYGTDVPGATSRTDGKSNTAAMAAADCPAALKVRALSIDGHSDWYLPSLGELNSAAANVPGEFKKEGYYWTSTQVSRDYAFVQGFEDGHSDWSDKAHERRVRAFRAIPLDHLSPSNL